MSSNESAKTATNTSPISSRPTASTAVSIPARTSSSLFVIQQVDLPRTPDEQLSIVRALHPTLTDSSDLDELHNLALRSLYLLHDFDRELEHCRAAMEWSLSPPLPIEELQKHYANVWALKQEVRGYLIEAGQSIDQVKTRARSWRFFEYPPVMPDTASSCNLRAMRQSRGLGPPSTLGERARGTG